MKEVYNLSCMENLDPRTELALRAFMQATPHLKWIADKNDNLVYANQSFLDYFHLGKDSLQKNIFDILPGELAHLFSSTHQQVRTNKTPVSTKLQLQKNDGSPLSLSVNSFIINGVVNPALVAGEALELPEKSPGIRLREQDKQDQSYLHQVISEAIWEWDIATGRVHRNTQMEVLTGYLQEEGNDLSWWFNRIHPADRERVQYSVAAVLDNRGCSWSEEYSFQCADGNYKQVRDRGYIVYEKQRAVKMVGSLQDITEIKQLREQLVSEKLAHQKEIAESIINAQEKERTFLGNELHDNVNQILTTARLYLEMLNPSDPHEMEIREKTREFIVMAYDEIRKLSKELVSPQLKTATISDAMNELVKNINEAGQFHVDYQCDPSIWLPKNLKITVYRIAQEQLKNTIQYSKAKNIRIELRSLDNAILLKIEDNGIGYDPNKVRQGIGLSNIYERVKLYGGTVEIKSSPGLGCSTTVIIPI